MTTNNVRKGVSQAKFNEEQSKILLGEISLISMAAGVYYGSWYVFGVVLISLVIILLIPYLNLLLAIALSLAWGGIGYILGSIFGAEAAVTIGVLALLIGFGIHISAIEWAKDIADPQDRNVL